MPVEFAQDCWMFLYYNSYSPLQEKARRQYYHTVIETHTIEKGLALSQPRPFFGQDKIRRLLRLNRQPEPADQSFPREMLAGALSDYRAAFAGQADNDRSIVGEIDRFLEMEASARRSLKGGVKSLELDHFGRNEVAIDFLKSRFSSRMFAPEPLSEDEILDISRIAQSAPSQCNRQSTRLYAYRDPVKLKALLELQSGAKGFVEEIPTLFIVTSDISAWGGPQQRNQPYVDGGLFAMMLLLSLSAHGFVSCPLNLAIPNSLERRIKREAGIHPRERLITMVAAGRAPAKVVKAAKSPRRPLEEVVCLKPNVSVPCR